MKEIIVGQNEAGQRLDKLLGKYLKEAKKSFLYKMLRKKNITLNGKKADGSEKLEIGDSVKIFFSEETLQKFTGIVDVNEPEQGAGIKEKNRENGDIHPPFGIVYEDNHVLIANKPAGMLSQKADKEDISFLEYYQKYLLDTGALTRMELQTFSPGICNRLDRNTSGILVAGKTLAGLQVMNSLFKERALEKYYLCIVKGRINKKQKIEGYLSKDENHNRVHIDQNHEKGGSFIQTEYEPVSVTKWENREFTLLKVNLITGKSHQIRAHLQSIGHPIIGDGKYGHKDIAPLVKKRFNLRHQLLHAYELRFNQVQPPLEYLSGRCFVAELPEQFKEIMQIMGLVNRHTRNEQIRGKSCGKHEDSGGQH